jgi:hypothetical protein
VVEFELSVIILMRKTLKDLLIKIKDTPYGT